MQLPDFTIDHLKQLPLRAIVAFSARCARRVEPLAQRPEGHPERESRRGIIEAALRLAEDFAKGSDATPDPSVVQAIDVIATTPGGTPASLSAAAAVASAAHAAASAWHALRAQQAERYRPLLEGTEGDRTLILIRAIESVTVDHAALDAFTAAVEAYDAVGYRNEEFVAAALDDYNTLLELKLGRYPEPGGPIDSSPRGPLGRL